jgi:hypothetical protein
MTAFTIDGIFQAQYDLAATTLTGTINISGGTITSMDLSVPQFVAHFTQIYFNEPYGTEWVLSGQTPGSCDQIGCQEDYLVFTFKSIPGPLLVDFQQAQITYGAVVHNTYGLDLADYLAHGGTTTYYGSSLTGTICPLEGCAPWPAPPPLGVPVPVVGSGLPALLTLAVILLRWRHK